MGFYHQIGWDFRLKCSHHPILWSLTLPWKITIDIVNLVNFPMKHGGFFQFVMLVRFNPDGSMIIGFLATFHHGMIPEVWTVGA